MGRVVVMRACVVAVVVAALAVSCGSDSETTPASATPTDVPGDADGVRVGCPNGPFFPVEALGSTPVLIPDSSVPEAADAMAEFLGGEEGENWPQEGWRVLDVVVDEQVLVVHPGSGEDPQVAFMALDWRSTGWEWAGASMHGDCVLELEPDPGEGVVDWVIDPDAGPVGPDTTTVTLLATERGCASGQPMGERLQEPVVTLTEDTVLILLTVQPPPGDQSCPSNPTQRVEVQLPEPLGDRVIEDARSARLGELSDILRELIGE